MPKLAFHVEAAKPIAYAASPGLALSLSLRAEDGAESIQSVLLTLQVWIEVQERTYDKDERARLMDLFGEGETWARTLRRAIWTTTSIIVPAFSSHTTVDVPLPCPFDFESTPAKYLFAVSGGAIPITLQFSGSVFFRDGDGALQVAPIPWSSEARFRLPHEVYRTTIDHYYPNRATLSLRRDVFDSLYRYKVAAQIPTWEATVERLLSAKGTT